MKHNLNTTPYVSYILILSYAIRLYPLTGKIQVIKHVLHNTVRRFPDSFMGQMTTCLASRRSGRPSEIGTNREPAKNKRPIRVRTTEMRFLYHFLDPDN